jgi:hypothetical protein
MIVALGADKGSPGTTTLAVLLGMHWPGERAVIELDPRGADLPYRMIAADGQPLAASPSITTVAVDSRPGGAQRPLTAYTQDTALGVPVITGETSSRRFARIAEHLGAITDAATTWPGMALVDVGSLTPGNPALQLARAATVTVLVSRADTESLARLRERVEQLAGDLGGPYRARTPLAVVARADAGDQRQAGGRLEKLLASIGSPVPVIGTLPTDSGPAAALWSGGPVTRRLSRSSLVGAAREITERLFARWPELTEPAAVSMASANPSQVATGVSR